MSKESINILIVEDEAIAGMMLEMSLKREGYHVVGVVPSGEKAIQIINQHPVDLILMDIQLEGSLDGIQTIETLLKSKIFQFIFMTGYPDPNIMNQALKLNPLAYIIKPVVSKNLLEILNKTF